MWKMLLMWPLFLQSRQFGPANPCASGNLMELRFPDHVSKNIRRDHFHPSPLQSFPRSQFSSVQSLSRDLLFATP